MILVLLEQSLHGMMNNKDLQEFGRGWIILCVLLNGLSYIEI